MAAARTTEGMQRVLILEPLHPDALARLSGGGFDIVEGCSTEPDSYASQARDCAVILTRGKGRIDARILSDSPLRCVGRCGAGVDNIDVAAATRLRIPVLYSPDSTTRSVAEHTLMLMLAVARRLPLLDGAVKRGDWAVRNRVDLGIELSGRTLGIIGLGHIGRRVSELAQAFGMTVAHYGRTDRGDPLQWMALEDLLAWADFVSVHVPLNESTRGMLGAREFAHMKPGAFLVNTARAAVLDEPALALAIASGHLGGAGLDLLSDTSVDNPLLRHDNVVVTPHLGTYTDQAFRQMCVEVVEAVIEILNGRRAQPENVYNLRQLEATL